MEREMKIIKTSQEDPVPPNVRANIKEILESWKDTDDKMFIDTRAAQQVLKCIKENSCVTISASSGAGKTATLRHVALQMAENEYDVLPVTYPDEIKNEINIWTPVIDHLKTVLETNLTKTIVACRLQVYKDEKFECLSVFKSCVCNILSENMCLLKTEKDSIAKLYLKEKASDISQYHDLYDCFPLLCKLYHDNPNREVANFFQNPFSVYEAEIDKLLEKGYHTKYCALALCVVLNNNLKEEMLIEKVNEETRTIIENICAACKLDRGTSRTILLDELDSLTHTFIKKEGNVYKTIHGKIFDILAYYFAKKIKYCLIQNADSGVIKERFLLERNDDMEQFITVVPKKYHQIYMQRMCDDWSKGKWFCNHGVDADNCSDQSPVSTACAHGHIEVVKLLLDNGADFNHRDDQNQSCVMNASEHGHTEVVKLLLEKGADFNQCDYRRPSSLMKFCKHGHTDIVKMLLDRGADCHSCDKRGRTSIMKACANGHTKIVKMLLDNAADCHKCNKYRGVDFNKRDNLDYSPVMIACEAGHAEIIKILLDNGADYKYVSSWGQSPVMEACIRGHTEIIKMLLDKGEDLNTCNSDGESLVMVACKRGRTEIVKMLLGRGADCNRLDNKGQSPLMKASEYGHTEIINLLQDTGGAV
ncbi:unnamed protein product [Mytilus coruscus]|uniref:Novel STAND NTPase 3 domain-containing protein n=1 Tax=Mytilus coruscus TaxID=42192 RepID=A0A6J8AYY0_MYTCO|nr:unnamed protein product [Mytilus coruscus]